MKKLTKTWLILLAVSVAGVVIGMPATDATVAVSDATGT